MIYTCMYLGIFLELLRDVKQVRDVSRRGGRGIEGCREGVMRWVEIIKETELLLGQTI